MAKNKILHFLTGALLGIGFSVSCQSKSESGSEVSIAALTQLLQGGGSGTTSNCRSFLPKESGNIYVGDQIVSAPANSGIGFKDSYCSANGVRGIDLFDGSLDVYTLDPSGVGALLVLGWSGKKVLPGPGIDFMVYENPFFIGVQNNTNPFNSVFLEPIVVEVGNDLTNWCGWNPTYTNSNPSVFSNDPSVWARFAGITPFVLNQESNPMTVSAVYNPDVVHGGGGGDGFDLAEPNFGATGSGCTGTLKNDLQTNGFLYIKLVPAITVQPSLPIPAGNGTPDIDGVIARNLSP
ncbi:LIC_13355 family lipoprotein [Leptospira fletcheri]|uniref:LIC_13355 family lipoprotein n=1 Tax=Leptospira fletcheri TaxID=2484981 RepID=A0A4R9GH00_9LEPT|nr:LIC_13355 family lipoprotein [Leptospira fletcheri]TGK11839.1 LIC_13355 family lipoprotein [Leptospira fletcheri]